MIFLLEVLHTGSCHCGEVTHICCMHFIKPTGARYSAKLLLIRTITFPFLFFLKFKQKKPTYQNHLEKKQIDVIKK
jgi:hypothetical protein